MYVKLKEDEEYHFCEEHLKEIGKFDDLKERDNIDDAIFRAPKHSIQCERCRSLASNGNCTPLYVEIDDSIRDNR